jgi:hypothetical protein
MEQVMKLIFTYIFPPSSYLIFLRYEVFLSTLFLNTHNLCSPLCVRDHISHSYKTTAKFIV